jgi:Holliday junction DNA helicase RuvA
MFDYLNGLITKIESSYIVLDVSGIGFKVYTPNPYVFEEGAISKVYLYNHVREDENTLYGFKKEEERNLFLKLINVKGLGPKLALPILATGSVEGIKDAINRENIMYLKKFPKIGEKVARQIILDLKGKVESTGNVVNTEDELYEVLISLGYKQADINSVIKQVNKDQTIEMQVKEALKLLLR